MSTSIQSPSQNWRGCPACRGIDFQNRADIIVAGLEAHPATCLTCFRPVVAVPTSLGVFIQHTLAEDLESIAIEGLGDLPEEYNSQTLRASKKDALLFRDHLAAMEPGR